MLLGASLDAPQLRERARGLDAELQRALANPGVRKKLDELGVKPMPMSAADFSSYARAEHKRWAPIIKTAGIRLD